MTQDQVGTMKNNEGFKLYLDKFLTNYGISIQFKKIFSQPGIYVVGGAVRDFLLGLKPADFDFLLISSSYNYDDFKHFSENINKFPIELGRRDDKTLRIALGEDQYLDFLFADELEEDIKRRDFTVNSLIYDVFEAKIVDNVNGLRDIENKILRANCEKVILDDPLRIIRGYRFINYGFVLDETTHEYLKRHSSLISNISVERIMSELFKILSYSNSHEILEIMYKDGLLVSLFPILKDMDNCTQNRFHHLNVLEHSLKVIEYIDILSQETVDLSRISEKNVMEVCSTDEVKETLFVISSKLKNPVLLKFAALFHDAGKPASKTYNKKKDDISFYSHEKVSSQLFNDIAISFKISNMGKNYVDNIIKHHMNASIFSDVNVGKKAYYRLLKKIGPEYIYDFLLFSFCDRLGAFGTKTSQKDLLDFNLGIRQMLRYHEKMNDKIRKPLIMGRDLLEIFEIKPDKIFTVILEDIEEKYSTGEISDMDEAIDYIQTKYHLSKK